MKASEIEIVNYAHLFPADWVKRHAATTLWIDAYRVPYPSQTEETNYPRRVDLGDVCITFVRSILRYPSVRSPAVDLATSETWSEVELHPPQMRIPLVMDDWVPRAPQEVPSSKARVVKDAAGEPLSILVLHNVQLVNNRTNLGTFALVATPHSKRGEAGNEEGSREQLKTAAGLLGAVMGRNAIYEPIFSLEFESTGLPTNGGSVVLDNPEAFDLPNLSKEGFEFLGIVAARTSALHPPVRDRTRLSLRWLYQAMSERDGTLSLLKYWIAIETLAMPNTSNIKPVIQRLAEVYDLSEDEARKRFAVGHLFDRRNKIVHEGARFTIGQALLAYLEGIYVDLLAQAVRAVSRRAERVLRESGCTAVELVTSQDGKVGRRRQNNDPKTDQAGVANSESRKEMSLRFIRVVVPMILPGDDS